MSIDRAAAVRQAEKLLRRGKLEQAIAEYLRLVEDQPRDWNTANLLGDLYVRAGKVDHAVAQFARMADGLCHEGFLPKASAVYKKILKLQPESDRALIRAGELAAELGLLADARTFYSTAASARRHHGDTRGALNITVKLGALDPADVPARLAAARARVELDDTPGALHEYTALAAWLAAQGREPEAVAPLRAVLELDPGSATAARDLARLLVSAGRFDEAAPYLTPENIGADPVLIRITAQLRLEQGDVTAGLELVDRLLIGDDDAPVVVAEMVESLAAAHPERAWLLTERLVGASVERADWTRAAGALRRFIAHVPHNVSAHTRLLDVSVDGAMPNEVLAAQALLADAYLAAGAAGEAKYVAEDLLTHQPWDRAHYARMRAALQAEGQADPDRALADWLAETPEFRMGDSALFDVSDASDATVQAAALTPLPALKPESDSDALCNAVSVADPSAQWLSSIDLVVMPAPSLASAEGRSNPHAIDLDLILGTPSPPSTGPVEEDLSEVVEGIRPTSVPVAPGPVAPARPSAAPADLDSVFAAMRDEALHRSPDEATDVAFTRGAAMVEAGELEQCIEPLRRAARAPRRRFAAATLLAQVYERQQRLDEAIEWLGHAVDAPGVTDPDRFETLLRMAGLLEQRGEPARALAVCLELQADAGNYKDLSVRIARLSRAQAGG